MLFSIWREGQFLLRGDEVAAISHGIAAALVLSANASSVGRVCGIIGLEAR